MTPPREARVPGRGRRPSAHATGVFGCLHRQERIGPGRSARARHFSRQGRIPPEWPKPKSWSIARDSSRRRCWSGHPSSRWLSPSWFPTGVFRAHHRARLPLHLDPCLGGRDRGRLPAHDPRPALSAVTSGALRSPLPAASANGGPAHFVTVTWISARDQAFLSDQGFPV